MDDFKTIYIICKDGSINSFRVFKNNIPKKFYEKVFIEDFAYFQQNGLPENRSIIFFEISLDTIDDVVEIYNSIIVDFIHIIIFIVSDIGKEIITTLYDLDHHGAIFPPYSKDIVIYTLTNSLKRMDEEIKRQEKHDSFLHQHQEIKNKLRELESIFNIYHIVDKERKIDTLFIHSLPIISRAFNFNSNLSIRIKFMEKEYKTENFIETRKKISDQLIDMEDFHGTIDLFINDDDYEDTSFSFEELNTFSTIRSLLSKALEGIIYEEMGRLNFEYSMVIYSLFKNHTNGKYSDEPSIFLDTISRINTLFSPDLCFIIDFSDSSLNEYKSFCIEEDKGNECSNITKLVLSKFERTLRTHSKKSLFFENSSSHYIILPFLKKKKTKGFLVLCFQGDSNTTKFFQNSLFGMVCEFLSLALASLEYLNNIKIYKKAIEQNPASIIITNLSGIIEYVNPCFEKVTGYSSREIVGKTAKILKSGFHDNQFYRKLIDTVTSGKFWHGDLQTCCKNGTVIWESTSIFPIKDSLSNNIAYMAIQEDITEKILAEEHLKKINEKLISTQTSLVQEEKMASIGRLAAGVAHELNNPIGFINSNFRSLKRYISRFKELYNDNDFIISEELKEKYQTDFIFDDLDDILEDSNEGFDRVIKIINSLRSFSRIDQGKTETHLDINELLKNTLIVARNEIKYKAYIHMEYGKIPFVLGDAGEINQVLLNLIVNASQAVGTSDPDQMGNIYISTYLDDSSVVCRIKDDGPGIPEEDRLKVFDPFYTTKPVGKGTGLGLSISYDIIVNKHNGELFIEDDSSDGTEFVIKLPIGEK